MARGMSKPFWFRDFEFLGVKIRKEGSWSCHCGLQDRNMPDLELKERIAKGTLIAYLRGPESSMPCSDNHRKAQKLLLW